MNSTIITESKKSLDVLIINRHMCSIKMLSNELLAFAILLSHHKNEKLEFKSLKIYKSPKENIVYAPRVYADKNRLKYENVLSDISDHKWNGIYNQIYIEFENKPSTSTASVLLAVIPEHDNTIFASGEIEIIQKDDKNLITRHVEDVFKIFNTNRDKILEKMNEINESR